MGVYEDPYFWFLYRTIWFLADVNSEDIFPPNVIDIWLGSFY